MPSKAAGRIAMGAQRVFVVAALASKVAYRGGLIDAPVLCQACEFVQQ